MTPDQARQELARRELERRGAVPQTFETSKPENAFDTPLSKTLYRGGGQVLGDLLGGAVGLAGGPADPVTVPLGEYVGNTVGAAGGEALRQLGSILTGGKARQSATQNATDLLNAGAEGAGGFAAAKGIGAAVEKATPAVVGSAKMLGRAVMRNIPDPILSYAKQRISAGKDILNLTKEQASTKLLATVDRVAKAVQGFRRQPIEAPSPNALYPVAEKAQQAFEAVRKSVSSAYGTAASAASEKPVRVAIDAAGKEMAGELRRASLIDAKGRGIAFGAREFTGDQRTLLNVFQDLKGTSPKPIEGMATANEPGTFANYDTANRLLAVIDEGLGVAKTANAKRILIQAKKSIMSGLKEADSELAKVVPAYGQFAGLRDAFESVLENPDKTVSLFAKAGRAGNQYLYSQLKALDALAPQELKFVHGLDAFFKDQSKAEASKAAPALVSKFIQKLDNPQKVETFVRNIFNQPETVMRELHQLDSAVPFLDDFKDLAAYYAFHGQPVKPQLFGLPGITAGIGATAGSVAGPVGAAVGGGAGLAAGMAAQTPSVQGILLSKLIPASQRMGRAASAAGEATAPLGPASVSTLLRLLRGENN